MAVCIYCGNDIDKENDEHIIPNSIGGLLQAKDIICWECNSDRFGRGIDATFAEQFNPLRVLFGVKSGRGKEAPPLKGLDGDKGGKYDLIHGGVPTLSKPDITSFVDDEGFKWVEGTVRSEKELRKLMKNVDKTKLVYEKTEKVSKRIGEALGIAINFGGEDVFRVITKTATNLLAYRFGNEYVLDNDFNGARDLVLSGGFDKKPITTYFAINDYSLPAVFKQGVSHSVIVFEDNGKIKALVTLFGYIQYGSVLGWGEIPNDFYYVVNPLLREHDYGEIDFDIRLENLDKTREKHRSGDIFVTFESWVSNILELKVELDIYNIFYERLAEAIIARYGYPRPIESIDDDELDAIISDTLMAVKKYLNEG